jgi:hypothetical protein
MRWGRRGMRMPKRKKSENWPMAMVRTMKFGCERQECLVRESIVVGLDLQWLMQWDRQVGEESMV